MKLIKNNFKLQCCIQFDLNHITNKQLQLKLQQQQQQKIAYYAETKLVEYKISSEFQARKRKENF